MQWPSVPDKVNKTRLTKLLLTTPMSLASPVGALAIRGHPAGLAQMACTAECRRKRLSSSLSCSTLRSQKMMRIATLSWTLTPIPSALAESLTYGKGPPESHSGHR